MMQGDDLLFISTLVGTLRGREDYPFQIHREVINIIVCVWM